MDFWQPSQELIRQLCSDFDSRWQVRKRAIDTHFLVLFIFKLVLSKNRQGYKSVLSEMWESPEIEALQSRPFSPSSLCEARQKLPEEIFTELNKGVLWNQEKSMPLPTWCGHRVFAADGSKVNLPHELLSAGYKATNQGQYYPQGLMSCLYHLGSGYIYDCLLSSDKSERSCLIEQMDILSQGDVLVLDRGYFSYLILYQAVEKGLHLICRLQSGTMNKEVSTFWQSDLTDTVINYSPSAAVKAEIKKQGYELDYKTIPLRLIKYQIDDQIYVCATTLIGKHYPCGDFPRVYHSRWGIEELYKISKVLINIEEFHSTTDRGIKQELYAHALLINIARIIEAQASQQTPPPDKKNDNPNKNEEIKSSYWQAFCGQIQTLKISFKNCLLVMTRFIEKLLMAPDKENNWRTKMVKSICRVRQKIRPGRHFLRQSKSPGRKWRSSYA